MHDVIKPIFNEQISDKNELYFARLCTIIVSILVCILSIKFDEMLDLIFYSLSLWAPIMSIPLYFVIFKLKVHRSTFFISLFCSSLMLILWENKPELIPNVASFIPGTVFSLMIFSISWLIMRFNRLKAEA